MDNVLRAFMALGHSFVKALHSLFVFQVNINKYSHHLKVFRHCIDYANVCEYKISVNKIVAAYDRYADVNNECIK